MPPIVNRCPAMAEDGVCRRYRVAYPVSSRPLRFPLRHLVLAAGLLLAGCTAAVDYRAVHEDADPHEGVARARTLPVHGIDVSRHQGKIDWDAVRAAGIDFAFIKATEGGDHLDPMFARNWEGAKRVGIARGAYHFVYWCRPAHEQILWYMLNVPIEPDALPPVLDLEWNTASSTCPQKVPREQALEKIKVMLAGLEGYTGKRPIIYTDINFHRDVLEGELPDYPFWLRSVAAEPHERYRNRGWLFWQYTTTGRVSGIKGNVDRNVFPGSTRDWEQYLIAMRQPRVPQILYALKTPPFQAYAEHDP